MNKFASLAVTVTGSIFQEDVTEESREMDLETTSGPRDHVSQFKLTAVQ